jgi:hypothetical protein
MGATLGAKKVPPAKPVPGANDWRPHSTPGFEINGLGQLRTAGHQPGNVPTPVRRPVVIEDWGDEDCS